MSMWLLHQTLSADEEARICERTDLVLPFEGLPDLTHVTNQAEARKLLGILHPDEPPESINRRLERFWQRFSNLQIEDIIAVPLEHAREVVIAEVTGHYHYAVGDKGSDIHLIPVRWYDKRIPLSKLAKYKEVFGSGGPAMQEITAVDVRTAVRDHLPHSYNRFVKMKWLLVIFFAMSLIRMFTKL